jgi:hypothetical protein
LEFFFEGKPVGCFEEEAFPSLAGRYRYEPYRGNGHYTLMTSIRTCGSQRCYYVRDRKDYYFTVLSCPEYGILELTEFDTPKPHSS